AAELPGPTRRVWRKSRAVRRAFRIRKIGPIRGPLPWHESTAWRRSTEEAEPEQRRVLQRVDAFGALGPFLAQFGHQIGVLLARPLAHLGQVIGGKQVVVGTEVLEQLL